MSEWISVKEQMPTGKEPVVYLRRKLFKKGYHVGIAYWTVSDKWLPEHEGVHAPEGFSHWMPLPDPPKNF